MPIGDWRSRAVYFSAVNCVISNLNLAFTLARTQVSASASDGKTFVSQPIPSTKASQHSSQSQDRALLSNQSNQQSLDGIAGNVAVLQNDSLHLRDREVLRLHGIAMNDYIFEFLDAVR
jgi:hypothetical protein